MVLREPKRRDLFRISKKDPNKEEMIFQPLPNLSNARDDTQQQSPAVENLWKGYAQRNGAVLDRKTPSIEHLFISFHMRRCLRDIKYSVEWIDSLHVTLSGSRRKKRENSTKHTNEIARKKLVVAFMHVVTRKSMC
ncbi:hypothetical protein CDAR_47671 [Caerostris darwini]|uniref:Uncharacterized protein n=1 Tax=Caerostris darwini TaxID=1538125 RepID=A0AAV4M9Y7_9ARAC|nr:hypothetical protein CDAR_47671 [Caerostris darwini]